MSLLSIEWLKIRRYRTFWVLAGCFAFILPFWNYQIANGTFRFGPQGMNVLGQSYSFPAVWENFGWWGGIFVLLLSMLIITLTCNEYSFRTHRQNVIDGWSRLSFFHAKFILALTVSLAATLFLFISGGLFGIVASGSASGIFDGIVNVGFFFLLVTNYLCAALFIAIWIRKSGLSIAVFLFYSLFIEISLKLIINSKSGTHIGSFLPLQSSDELLPYPLFSSMSMSGSAAPPDYAFVIASLAWIAVYYFAGRRMILNRDM